MALAARLATMLCGAMLTGCTSNGTSPIADAGTSPPSIRFDATIYPNGATERIVVEVSNMRGEVGLELDGKPLAVVSSRPIDGIVTLESSLPAGLVDGWHTLRATDSNNASAELDVPLRAEGVYEWSISARYYENECAEPLFSSGAGVMVLCARYSSLGPSDRFLLLQYRFAQQPPATPRVSQRILWMPAQSIYAALPATDANGGPDPLAVIARHGVGAAELYAADPRAWPDGEMPLRRLAGLTDDACGVGFWHGVGKTMLLVSGIGGMVAGNWPVPAGEEFVPVPVELAGGRHFCGIGTADMDRDGIDELITSFYSDRFGVSLFKGSPDTGFQLVLDTHSVEATSPPAVQQLRASFEDIDGDGLLDAAASNGLGGVDVIFPNGDGTFQLQRMLVVPESPTKPGATTLARLGRSKDPYMLIDNGWPHRVWRVLDRETAADDSWRVIKQAVDVSRRPMLVFDADGDGLVDLVGNDGGFHIALWRSPREDAARGLIGPRPMEYEELPDLYANEDGSPKE